MISADFTKKGECLAVRISGHADSVKQGADPVCAAVSGIFYALLGYAANECAELRLKDVRSGFADIECSMDGESAVKLTYIGLLQLALTYPEYLSVKESVWNLKINTPTCAA